MDNVSLAIPPEIPAELKHEITGCVIYIAETARRHHLNQLTVKHGHTFIDRQIHDMTQRAYETYAKLGRESYAHNLTPRDIASAINQELEVEISKEEKGCREFIRGKIDDFRKKLCIPTPAT